jgi:hypothetical protein
MSTAELDDLGARLLRCTFAAAFVGLDDPDTEPDRGTVFPWPGNGGAL